MKPYKMIRLIAEANTDPGAHQFISIHSMDRKSGMLALAISTDDAIAARCLLSIITDHRLQALNCDDVHNVAMTFLYLTNQADATGQTFDLGIYLFYDRDDPLTLAMQHIARVITLADAGPGTWPTIAYRISWLNDFAYRFKIGMQMLKQAEQVEQVEQVMTKTDYLSGGGIFSMN